MRSFSVVSGENALAQQFTNLRADARGAGNLLVHQQLGAIALPTNPTNGQTLTLTINGTGVVITFVTSIGTTAGNVLIGSSAAATCANLIALLNQPQTTTATGVALSVANQALVNYLTWPLSGTTITPSSNNTSLYAPQTSFTASTTATGGSYTGQTLQLYVEPGVVYVNGTRVIFAGGSTPTVTAPSTNPRIDVLAIDNTGTLSWTTGTENASPSAPTYPSNKVPLCELYNVVGETALYDNANQQTNQGYIYNDVRPTLGTSVNLLAVPSNILPDADGTRNLGSASFEWNNIYAKTAMYINGTAVTPGVTINAFFGDSGDGAATLDGTATVAWASKSGSVYTMTRDAYLTNLTVNGGVTLNLAGYKLMGTGTLAGSGIIAANGGAGANSAGGGPINGGTCPTGTLKGGGSGGLGGANANGTGGTGSSTTHSLGGNGGAGGHGGGAGGGGTGAAGTVTAGIIKLKLAQALYMFDFDPAGVTPYTGGAGGGGAGGGSGGSDFGGAGGAGGGLCWVAFNAVTFTGTISANGGAGGSETSNNNAGGGGGGGGGAVILIYASYSGGATLQANGGAAGTTASGAPATAGSAGSAGVVYQITVNS